jgi:hypothetical protein
MWLGFVVVPEPIRDSIVAALSVTGKFAPLLVQAALADFMNEGHFTRHLRRTRRPYAERRHYFLAPPSDIRASGYASAPLNSASRWLASSATIAMTP